MNTYGVLGRYIPAFGRIVGRMQYDLFHAYTVDAHTLFVREQPAPLRDAASTTTSCRELSAHHAAAAEAGDRLSRRAVPRHRQGPRRRSLGARRRRRRGVLPRAGPVALRRAPGRLAGAQSPGAVGHRAEAGHRAIPRSSTPSRSKVGDETHLDYLYVLTSADVRGTNPKLWNSWKASLFHEFYERVKRALRRGLESPIDPGRADARDAGRRAQAARRIAAASRRPRSTRAWERLHGRLLPAPHARGSGLAHAAARRARARQSKIRWSPCEPRSERGTTGVLVVRAASLQRLRRHHRGARPARPHHRRRAHHAHRRRLQPRPLPRARGRRRADHRHASAIGEIERALWRSLQRPGRCAGHGLAPRAAPGAHVPHADADRGQRRRAQPALGARADRRRPARACCATSARCSWKNASTCTPRRS